MGQTSKKLRRKLQTMGSPLGRTIRVRRSGPDIPSVEDFVKDGLDPVFAAYASVQHVVSHFAEAVSQLPEIKKFTRLVGQAEDEYMPTGPPMSPLTTSFFSCWAFLDCRFDGQDTLISCLIESNDVLQLNPHQLNALQKMAASRMGFYEHIGTEGSQIRLRELLTDKEFSCVFSSGYRGQKGELLYVRLLPPPEPEIANYHTAFTTPYVLLEATKDDWTQFLNRTMRKVKGSNEGDALHKLMKYGLEPNYWNEFVFKAYHHPQSEAIFLAGIPDLTATLPHA